MKLQNINPATNQIFAELESSTEQEIVEMVARARQAQPDWQERGIVQRVETLRKLYSIFESEKENIGALVTKSMGMPTTLRNLLDVDAGLHYFKWYLDHAEECLQPEVSYEDKTTLNTVYYEPIGVVAAISPWNFPFCNFIWSVTQSLVVGNTVVFKHAQECAAFGELLNRLFAQADLPVGVFSQVIGDGKSGDFLVHQDIDLISFTGSTAVGKYLYGVAAEKMIKVVLELGGSAPGIVFEDADMDKVIEAVYFNRFTNSGQACDGLKRLIVHKSMLEKVTQALSEVLKSKKIGDPEDPATEIGPLVSMRQLATLKDQVEEATQKGAKVAFSTDVPQDGAYHSPTVLTNVTTEMKVWTEEVFGPVLPIVAFETETEAVKLANDTMYGLGGYVFTEDKQRAARVAAQIKTGMVSTNGAGYLNPSSPFGGYKHSGIGREHGKYGFHDLCQVKVVATEK